MGYYEGEIGSLNTGNGNEGGFGGGWWGIVALVAVAAIFGGGNFGFGGGNRNNGGVTQADLCTALNFNNTDSAVRSLQSGLCDGFYAVNTGLLNGFAGVQQTLCQGFGGVNNAITTQGYQSQLATQSLSAQLASCCCDIERGIERVACQQATDTGAIISASQANTQCIIDYLRAQDIERKNERIAALQLENQNLRFSASQSAQNAFIAANQEAQTAELIRRLGRDNPVPAYIVPNPNCCYGYGNPYAYNGYGNNGCGCGAFGF